MIPQFEPWLGDEEMQEVAETIQNNWITGGPKVKQFEGEIARLCGTHYAIATCNGTLALYVGLTALGIGAGDEVIVPDFTFIASANAVVMAGAKPVFVDVDERTFNISPAAAERAVTPRTKAIMPVHIYGQAAEMPAIMEIARRYELKVIEDAAQGIRVSYQGRPVGSFGDVGCLSFYADKTMTTGEGGMVLTDDAELAERCLILKHQGRTGRGIYYHEHIGYNFRLTDLQAAVGLGQLRKLDEIVARKRQHEARYRELLGGVPGVEFPYIDPEGEHVPFRINILVAEPEALSRYLEGFEIGTRRFFHPLHLQPCYNVAGDFPGAIGAYERGLSLPSSATLTEEEIALVCAKIGDFMSGRTA
ncbi:DegT/DnrJ/EryC1/StrS family aminotransferase [Chloroflexota bacterium]